MEGVLDSTISSAESEESVINEEYDAWQADFKREAKQHLDDDDLWRYDGDEEDSSICSEKIGDADDVNTRDEENQDVYDDSYSPCLLASSTRSHLKYGSHVSAFPYVFPANEWSHEYPMTTCDLGLKCGFTCSEVDTVKHILETLLGFPNDLFDLVSATVSSDTQQFVLSYSAMHMRLATKLSAKTLHTILQWFAQLASDIHFCRRFAFEDNDKDKDVNNGKGGQAVAGSRARGYSPSSSSVAPVPPACCMVLESLRSAVLDLLVTVDRELCRLDEEQNSSSSSGGSVVAQAIEPASSSRSMFGQEYNHHNHNHHNKQQYQPYQLTLISLYSKISAHQWRATFSSLRAQISSVTATARLELGGPSAIPILSSSSSSSSSLPSPPLMPGLLTNSLMQAHFAMLRWSAMTHPRRGARLSSTLFSQSCPSSSSSSSSSSAFAHSGNDRSVSTQLQQQHAGQGLGYSAELIGFLQHLTVRTSGVDGSSSGGSSGDSSVEVAAAAAEFFTGRPLVPSMTVSRPPPSPSSFPDRQITDINNITTTDTTSRTRINNNSSSSSNNNSYNRSSNNSNIGSINNGLGYFQLPLGFDENDLDDSGHTDNDDDGGDNDDSANDSDDHSGSDDDDHDIIEEIGNSDHHLQPLSLPHPHPDRTAAASCSMGFDVSELMPWGAQLDLIVALPLARDRYDNQT